MSAWGNHLREFPLGEDKRLHAIVASIWVIMMFWSGAAKSGSRVTIYDIAPWLRSAAEWERVKKSEQEHFLQDRYSRFYNSLGITDGELDIDGG